MVEPAGEKCEIGWASVNSKLTVGDIVVHVALPGMRLAPRVLMRSDVLAFHKIDRSRVERRVQITDLNPDQVGYAVVVVAVMVVGNVPGGEGAGRMGLPRRATPDRLDSRLNRSCKGRNNPSQDGRRPHHYSRSRSRSTMQPRRCVSATTAQFVQAGRCYWRRYSCDTGSAEPQGDRCSVMQTNPRSRSLCCRNLFLPPGRLEFQHGHIVPFRAGLQR